jgi:hypothetical protein
MQTKKPKTGTDKNIFQHCGQLAGILGRISWEYPFKKLNDISLPRKREKFICFGFYCQKKIG